MEPSTDYVIYSAGIGSDGDNSTEVSIFRFTTGEPVSFELSQEVDGPMVTLNVKPSYDDRWYLSEAFTVAECGDKENAFGYITSFIQDECDMMSWYMGLSKEEYMRGILSIGESSKLKELYASTDYYAIAVAYDFECNATSEITITEFSTEAVKEHDLLISIDISEITSLGAKWKATTTTDDQYLLFVEAVDVINEQWSDDDEELARTIIDEWVDDDSNDFYTEVEGLLHSELTALKEEGIFDNLNLLKPYSFVLVDDEKETVADLLLIDDEDTLLLSGELLKGLDEELDAFLKDLLEK